MNIAAGTKMPRESPKSPALLNTLRVRLSIPNYDSGNEWQLPGHLGDAQVNLDWLITRLRLAPPWILFT